MLLFKVAGYAMNIVEIIFIVLVIAVLVDIFLLHKSLEIEKAINKKLTHYIELLDKENEKLKIKINKFKKSCVCGAKKIFNA